MSAEGESGFTIKASRGWFKKIKHLSGIHSVVGHGEVASPNKGAAKKYVGEFRDIVNAGGYLPQQVYNCDETGLFLNRMPNRTYITKEEKSIPGHRPMKNRITIIVCANANGDCKIKSMAINHSENTRISKRNKVIKKVKSKMPVMWKSNANSWCFLSWVYEALGPHVKEYLKEKQLPLKCLLVMDATVHQKDLDDNLPDGFDFIKVKFLTLNTTSLLQPIVKQVIFNFKTFYTRALF